MEGVASARASEALVRCFAVRPLGHDARADDLLADAHALGISRLQSVAIADLVFVAGLLSEADTGALAGSLLADPLLQTVELSRAATIDGAVVVETTRHPGVTDSLADAVRRGAALAGVTSLQSVATGRRFELHGPLEPADVEHLVKRLLSNPVVERHAVGLAVPAFTGVETEPLAEHIAVRGLDLDALRALSGRRGLALDDAELVAIAAWFGEQQRDPTDVELEMLAQTWSEHCAHKTFRADITWQDGTPVAPLLGQLRRATEQLALPWVRSAFVDNAGIIAFDDQLDLAIKVETHNHPSAVEPFGGANTGVGGVLRDVLGVGAKPIALTDVLCFGPTDLDADLLPDGVLHPRVVRSGVIAGVADYGNKLGVPTVSGAIVHHAGYTANPLVFCGCLGVLPHGTHRVGARPGDHVVVIGGRTGRDGIRGATFSSMAMDATTGEIAGASVQIGDPIVEKGLVDVVVEARDLGLYSAITDCGAGGLSSAVGEMAEGVGADVELDLVPRKYAGLAPWEAWLSEAQERMVLAVPDPEPLRAVCARYEVELADIGRFTGDGILTVRQHGAVVAQLPTTFLHDGRPRRQMVAQHPVTAAPTHGERKVVDLEAALLDLLAHPDIASKLDVVRGYDHEVLGGTRVRPYVGAADDGPADAAVLQPPGATGPAAYALACGLAHTYGDLDPWAMAHAAIDEAIRNVVAAGADPDRIALLDNFSWGDPRRPSTLGSLVEAVRACVEASVAHGSPFVSGKDSLNNEFAVDGVRRSVPPTLVITALGHVPDVRLAVTSDLKAAGNALVLVGATRDELRGSHLDAVLGIDGPGAVPQPDPGAPARYRRLHALMRAGLVRSAHDLSDGGLAVAATEMAMGGRLGLHLVLAGDAITTLFSESTGRFLLEVSPADLQAVLTSLGDDGRIAGAVLAEPTVRFECDDATFTVSLAAALDAWQGRAR
jgi:phosphoribosylformylglycinamidine synthase